MMDMVRSWKNRRAEAAAGGEGEREASYMSNTTIPCVLNGRASSLATVPATALAGIIAADTLAQPSIPTHTHTHTHILRRTHTQQKKSHISSVLNL